jgi:hypothetical protein
LEAEGKDAQGYFCQIDVRTFVPTAHVGGAWNITEQHVAPAIGLLVHAVEMDHRTRHPSPLQIARLSYDIWGTIPMAAVTIEVNVLRAGRTIELVEARLCHDGRPAIVLRTWLTRAYDSQDVAAAHFAPMPPPDTMPAWDPSSIWAGGFIASAQVRRLEEHPGRARCWIRSHMALIEQEDVSATARTMGLVDIANGLTPLGSPQHIAFPNLDLTAHLFRPPAGEWLGFDISVASGPTGIGLTHSILHDKDGPFGTMAQCLTVRPRA